MRTVQVYRTTPGTQQGCALGSYPGAHPWEDPGVHPWEAFRGTPQGGMGSMGIPLGRRTWLSQATMSIVQKYTLYLYTIYFRSRSCWELRVSESYGMGPCLRIFLLVYKDVQIWKLVHLIKKFWQENPSIKTKWSRQLFFLINIIKHSIEPKVLYVRNAIFRHYIKDP